MNIRYGERVYPQFDFIIKTLRCPDGSHRQILTAFSPDGTMWLRPSEIGVGPQHKPLLARFNKPYLLVCPRDQIVLINARAVAEVFAEPERRGRWLEAVEQMVREHQLIRAKYESPRNN